MKQNYLLDFLSNISKFMRLNAQNVKSYLKIWKK